MPPLLTGVVLGVPAPVIAPGSTPMGVGAPPLLPLGRLGNPGGGMNVAPLVGRCACFHAALELNPSCCHTGTPPGFRASLNVFVVSLNIRCHRVRTAVRRALNSVRAKELIKHRINDRVCHSLRNM